MKIENARSSIIAVLDAQERRPMAIGTDDCLQRLCEVLLAVLPDNARRQRLVALQATFRGAYSTVEEGYALLRAEGYPTPISLLRSLFERISLADAQDGDAAAVKQDGHWTFGVICGPHFFVTTQSGTGILPRSAATKIYRVS